MKILSRVLLVSALVATCFADVPQPKPKGQPVQMRIGKDSIGAGGAVLEIPASLFTKHAAILDLPPVRPSSATGLILSGILLAVAVFFLGRLMFRRKRTFGDIAGAVAP